MVSCKHLVGQQKIPVESLRLADGQFRTLMIFLGQVMTDQMSKPFDLL
jgi:hypothetical protein